MNLGCHLLPSTRAISIWKSNSLVSCTSELARLGCKLYSCKALPNSIHKFYLS